MDKLLMQPVQEGNGWVRYYFIVETADAGVTVNVALFNGSIDGATLATGTVYYDQVTVEQLGSYTIGEDTENEDATLYQVKYSAKSGSGYADLFETHFANVDGKTATMNTIEFNFDNAQVVRLADAEKWEEMRTIPEEEEDVEEDDDHDHDHDHDHDEFDWGLFWSAFSSAALIVGLGVAIVVKLFRKKR